ncbi:unnamed protein product [Clonostachys rhizophaga]|uniref:Uncharacterized protein n=1 Tax=Clonostachys rhizophaga TaxID=160324 RepID=A0A9N9YPD1_9HYPO|nr:unnamed protein product [Clonostachys rhizophaga]
MMSIMNLVVSRIVVGVVISLARFNGLFSSCRIIRVCRRSAMNWPSLLQIVETEAPAACNVRPSYRPSDRMEVVESVDTSDLSPITAHVDENPAAVDAPDDSRAKATKHILILGQTGAKIGPRYRLCQGEGGKEGQQLKKSEFHGRSDSIE